MNTRKLILGGAVTAIGLLGFATAGLAVAQTGGDATPTPAGHHGNMGDHGAMPGQMGQMGQAHEPMHEAVAKALGLTVDEFNAQIAAGKTVPDIAREKGIDMATVTAAMQAAHPDGYGPGMMGNGTTHAGCPQM